MSDHHLEKKTYVVTGSSSGIGFACTQRLLDSGAIVVSLCRRVEKVSAHPNHHVIHADLREENIGERLASYLRERELRVDGSVHAAGLSRKNPWKVYNEKKAKELMEINFWVVLRLLSVITHFKIRSKQSSNVVFSSISTQRRYAGMLDYAAAKSALESSVGVLAKELAPAGVRLNALRLGVVETPMTEELLAKERSDWESRSPLGIGRASDVVEAVMNLLSEESRWQTGAILNLDGGYLA